MALEEKGPRQRWNPESIRALRSYMGLTQDQMAQELGTRQQTISEWERGLYKPRGASNTLLRIVAERAGFSYRPEGPDQKLQDARTQA